MPIIGKPGKAVFKLGKLEFRTGNGGKGAQSVFPPSVHPSGVSYKWTIAPRDAEVMEIPDAVLTRLWNSLGDGAAGEAEFEARPPEHWERDNLF